MSVALVLEKRHIPIRKQPKAERNTVAKKLVKTLKPISAILIDRTII